MREREGNLLYEIEPLRVPSGFHVDKPCHSLNTEIEALRVDMELEPLRVEFQVDSTRKKTKSEHEN